MILGDVLARALDSAIWLANPAEMWSMLYLLITLRSSAAA